MVKKKRFSIEQFFLLDKQLIFFVKKIRIVLFYIFAKDGKKVSKLPVGNKNLS